MQVLPISSAGPFFELPIIGTWKEQPKNTTYLARTFSTWKIRWQLTDILKLTPDKRISLILNLHEQIDDLFPELKHVVASLTLAEKQTLVTKAAETAIRIGKPSFFRQVAKLFTLQDMEILIKANVTTYAWKLATLHSIHEQQTVNSESTPQTYLDCTLKLLNAVRAAFNLLEAAKTPDSYYEGTYLLDIFCKLILIPWTMVTFLNIFVPAGIAMAITASTLISLYVVLQVLPQKLVLPEGAIDLTEEARQGKIKYIPGRKDDQQRLVNDLISKSYQKPTLTGKAGIGKTSIAKNLAVDIVQGRVPELAGKRIIWVNSASLIPGRDSDFKVKKPFPKLIDALGKELKNAIIFFDELQGALLQEGALAQELKTQMPPRYFAACTAKDFAKVVSDEGLRTRFGHEIQIQNLSKWEVCQLLADEAITEAPEFEFTMEFFEAIYKKTENESQPQASLDLFARLLVNLRTKRSPELNAVIRLRQKIDALLVESSKEDIHSQEATDHVEQIQLLRSQLTQAEADYEEYKNKLRLYGQLKTLWYQSQQQSIKLAHALQKNSDEEQQKELLFRAYFLEPEIKKRLVLMKLENHIYVDDFDGF